MAGVRPPGPAGSREASESASGSRPTSTARTTSGTSPSGRVRRPASRLGDGDRARPTGLAHRMLGDEHGPPRAVVRHPHRRDRPRSSRTMRTRSPRARRRRARPFVGTWLHCAHLQMSGSKMAKSTGNIARVAELLATGRLGSGAAPCTDLRPLPGRTQPLARFAGGRRGRARPARRGCRGPRRVWRGRSGRPGAARHPRGGPGRLRRGARRRPQRVGRSRRRVRPHPRPQPAHRRAVDVDGGRRAGARDAARSRSGPGILPDAEPAEALDPAVASLLEARVAARAARDFAASDRLRDELAAIGVMVEDTRDGQRWRRTVEVGRG